MVWGLCLIVVSAALSPDPMQMLFVSSDTNDMYQAAARGATPALACALYADVDAALLAARPHDALLVTAEAMVPAVSKVPQTNTTVNVTAAQWDRIESLNLSVYIEFPGSLPAFEATTGAQQPAAAAAAQFPVQQTLWERAVVARNLSQPGLAAMTLLHPHKRVDYVRLPAALLPLSDLVLGVVAGYDSAEFGLPPAAKTFPLLARARAADPPVLAAATQLSHCRTRRFSPSARWMAVVAHVLGTVTGGQWTPPAGGGALWVPTVAASFTATEPLPPDAELTAMQRGVGFYRAGGRAIAVPTTEPVAPSSDLTTITRRPCCPETITPSPPPRLPAVLYTCGFTH
jgi:hypothetical protein